MQALFFGRPGNHEVADTKNNPRKNLAEIPAGCPAERKTFALHIGDFDAQCHFPQCCLISGAFHEGKIHQPATTSAGYTRPRVIAIIIEDTAPIIKPSSIMAASRFQKPAYSKGFATVVVDSVVCLRLAPHCLQKVAWSSLGVPHFGQFILPSFPSIS